MNVTVPKLVFATNNTHKLDELRRILAGKAEVLSLSDIGCEATDIPETSDTLQGNAVQKATYIRSRFGIDCFADDTGLMVDALNGAPGVYSARYAGEAHDSEANVALLLRNMEGVTDRRAHFSTVIALTRGEEVHCFEGRVDGEITRNRHGDGGFGYDPIFRPVGSSLTFAEMDADSKNAISHRGRAVARLSEFLSSSTTHPS